MFEFSLAFKYLLPKSKQLSVALISLMSVMVISIVVWLLVVFLSVTQGLEQGWLSKLTNLNAPLRINPTQAYFSSYYYNIDNYSQNSNFHLKSVGEKLRTKNTDPFDPEIDRHVSNLLPTPDRKKDGSLKDPVKTCFKALEELKSSFPGLTFQDYTISGASLRLELSRDSKGQRSQSHSFLNQVAYAVSFADKSSFQSSLILSPTADDFDNLLDVARKETKPSSLFSLENLLAKSLITEVTTVPYQWNLPSHLLPKTFSCPAVAYLHEDGTLRNIVIAQNKKELNLLGGYSYAKQGVLRQTDVGLEFEAEDIKTAVGKTSITLSFPLKFRVSGQKLIAETNQIILDTDGSLLHNKIQGKLPFNHLQVAAATFKESAAKTTPPWVYQENGKYKLPQSTEEGFGIVVPKNFYETGARVGDQGYLSYSSMTASAVHEQKIPVFISGFYDPGIMGIGGKYLLVPEKLSAQLSTSASSYAVEKKLSNGVLVWLDDVQKTAKLQAVLEAAFQKEGIESYFSITPFFEYDFAKDILQQFQSDKVLFTLVGIIILTVACCNILSLLNLMVNDKKKEIAILQTLGASKKSLVFTFSFCGLLLGVISSLIGLLLAYLTLANIDSLVGVLTWIQGYNPFNEAFYGNSLPRTLSKEAVYKVLIFTPLLALIAGFIPSLKAVKIAPSSTLRSE